MKTRILVILFSLLSCSFAERFAIISKPLHLRNQPQREWSEFPQTATASSFRHSFDARPNLEESVLWIRQRDVKESWSVTLNNQSLGRLVRDENAMRVAWRIPKGKLKAEGNLLEIKTGSKKADDIEIGPVILETRSLAAAFSDATIRIQVTGHAGSAIPSRITITHPNGALAHVIEKSSDRLAVRHGTIFTLDGKAQIGLPAGRYKIYAGRGFEYSVATKEVTLERGSTQDLALKLEHQVPVPGYVSCDTHIHTGTYARHGDATLTERMITLAAEGIEMPISTEHNQHIDYEEEARRIGARTYFTPVIGNEVTTKFGHFNIFPIAPNTKPPDATGTDWKTIFGAIQPTGARIVILNHGRDIHAGYRPLGPEHHLSVAGENLDGWTLEANAMEIINSGATQTAPLELFHDWQGMLNRGFDLTPAGCSDSHDVARYIVGQARTYVACPESKPGAVPVETAVSNVAEGKVMVSFGLLASLKIHNGKVDIKVLGPHWTTADRITLYANGSLIRAEEVLPSADVVKYEATWALPELKHDTHFALVATGPDPAQPYWKVAKPYQPTSPDWSPRILGFSGAVWVDADDDGLHSSAAEYANALTKKHGEDTSALLKALSDYDASVSIQVARIMKQKSPTAQQLRKAAPHVREAFEKYQALTQ